MANEFKVKNGVKFPDNTIQTTAAAPLASPAFTGTPTAPTAAVGTNTTQLATTAFVNSEIANDAPTKTGGGASGSWGISVTGNAATATTLQTARTINGTSFNGSANITTANWGTSRTITIGSTGKSVDGSANISWTVAEIGALANVTPGTSGNVLTSNGTSWVSQAPPTAGQYLGTAATKAIAFNSNTIGENITVTTGLNGLSAGPITISNGFTVTINSGAVWVIV